MRQVLTFFGAGALATIASVFALELGLLVSPLVGVLAQQLVGHGVSMYLTLKYVFGVKHFWKGVCRLLPLRLITFCSVITLNIAFIQILQLSPRLSAFTAVVLVGMMSFFLSKCLLRKL